MKALYLFPFAFLAAPFTSSAINFHGEIMTNTTWTKANSPYVLDGQVIVLTGAMLTIEPGVEIQFGNENFIVDGSIKAEGTPTEPILFTPADKKPYAGDEQIRLRNTQDAIFRHCVFQTKRCGVRGGGDTILIEYSKFENSSMWISQTDFVTITKCLADNSRFSLYAGEGKFTDNTLSYSNLSVEDGSLSESTYLIKNNKIMFGTVAVTSRNTTVDGNIMIGDRTQTGLSIYGSVFGTVVKNNIIAYHERGILISSMDSFVISSNTIKHNKNGIELKWIISVTKILQNCLDSNSEYNIVNVQSGNHDFSNNYWGTTDSALIRAKIHDYYRDFYKGKIHYMPVLTQADPSCRSVGKNPLSIPANDLPSASGIDAYPNPFTSTFTVKTEGLQPINEIVVYNAIGTRIHTEQKPAGTAKIDLNNYPAGMYIYTIKFADNSTYTGKLQKQ